jgi:hypothetical protein
MVYKTYSRYIQNLARKDGSAAENRYAEAIEKKSSPK